MHKMHKKTKRALAQLDEAIKALMKQNDNAQSYRSKVYISQSAITVYAKTVWGGGLSGHFIADHIDKYATILNEHHKKHHLFCFHNTCRKAVSYDEALAEQKADYFTKFKKFAHWSQRV